jgi:hypothetical protein
MEFYVTQSCKVCVLVHTSVYFFFFFAKDSFLGFSLTSISSLYAGVSNKLSLPCACCCSRAALISSAVVFSRAFEVNFSWSFPSGFFRQSAHVALVQFYQLEKHMKGTQ